jgi:RsiW-degrading membrane proteinase PrsW (M82 family)
MGLGIALGAALGAALGVMAGHVAVWLAIGVAIGLAIGSTVRRKGIDCPACAQLHETHVTGKTESTSRQLIAEC